MKILLLAYYDRNFGDDCMVRLFLRSFPEHEVYLCCRDETLLLPYADLPNLRVFRGGLKAASKDKRFDGVVYIGGSIFIIHSFRHAFIRMLTQDIPLWRVRRRDGLLVYLGCNMGPFRWKHGKRFVRLELKRASLTTVRDRFSLAVAEGRRCRYHADLLFSLNLNRVERLGTALGITCYNSIQYTAVCEKNAAFLARMADRYIETTGNEVILFAFDTGKENDLFAAHLVLSLMKNPKKARIAAHLDNGETILSAMEQCRALVCVRLHAAVAALQMGLPLLPVAYSDKLINLLEDLSFPGNRYDWGTLYEQSAPALLEEVLAAPRPQIDTQALAQDACGHLSDVKALFSQWEAKHKR